MNLLIGIVIFALYALLAYSVIKMMREDEQ